MRFEQQNETLFLQGELSFSHVPNLYQQATQLLKNEKISTIDCAGVNSADSAGLALLIALQRQAHSVEQVLRFLNLPEKLQALARVCHVEQLLSQEPNGQ